MKYKCEMIQDLLPLYKDQVCSEASRQMVEEHLEECPVCKKVEEQLENTEFDYQFEKEKNHILSEHNKKMQKKMFTVGASIAGVLLVPILVCLVCNLAVGHSLDWFFIVLSSIMVLASITVIPLVVETKKVAWTFVGFTGSVLLLLLVCNLYTGGSWFFIAGASVVLGVSVLFLPLVMFTITLPGQIDKFKPLMVMVWDTVWLFLVLFSACTTGVALANGILISLAALVLPWFIFIVICYVKINGYFKAAICTAFTGIFGITINPIINYILQEKNNSSILGANLTYWNEYNINSNIGLLLLIACLVCALILTIIGIKKSKQA